MADDSFETGAASSGLTDTMDKLALRQRDLEQGANRFSSAMTGAFSRSIVSGRSFDDTLKSLALRLSDVSVRMAFRPLTTSLGGGLTKLFGGLFPAGNAADPNGNIIAAAGAIKPFAAGGVIGTPTYFPLSTGGMGLAGEAGPEAILPLARGRDGRLGVAGGGSGSASINVHISTPDAESFRRSESYLTGQIARAVARGQRGM
jgi:phage-related minor tail protein